MATTEKTLFILDFGSQYTQLIARRIREMGVFTRILPPDTPYSSLQEASPLGLILSGGPGSLTQSSLPFDPKWLETSLPLLGICYGMQLMNHLQGGEVKSLEKGEYGKQQLSLKSHSPLFQTLPEAQTVWMSHRDSVERLAPCYQESASTSEGIVAAMHHLEKPHFGLQFHPEVTHTEWGGRILENFLQLCGAEKNWTLNDYMESALEAISQQVGEGRVVSLVSGGVDSTVATCLCQRALGSDRVFALYVDTGLMRQGETEQVTRLFREQGFTHFNTVDASSRFLEKLKGVVDAEEKRKIIGTTFVEVLQEEMDKLHAEGHDTFFCQGTLYTDLIESGKGCGQHAAVIKSHHNVNVPLVEEKRQQGRIVEPNKEIFKDEVREVAQLLGLPPAMIWRHPFPGPGLGIRIIGEVTEERLKRLRQADAIYLEEIERAGLYPSIWQAFAVLIPVTTVGVMGDQRTEGNVVALRAVTSRDGMTADTFPFPYEVLGRTATRIVNEVQGVNRVVYDVTSKPPGTIEWE